MRSALISYSNNTVTNIIVADPAVDAAPEGHILIALPDDSPVSIGWTYDGSQFVDPNPTVASATPLVEEVIVP